MCSVHTALGPDATHPILWRGASEAVHLSKSRTELALLNPDVLEVGVS